MEEQFNNMDRITKKYIKEAGTHKPSPDFLSNVMSAIETKPQRAIGYQPLISVKAWWVIGMAVVISAIALYFNPTSSIQILNEIDLSSKLSFTNPFEGLKFSKTLVYGIGFLGMFLLQIPFLKKSIEQGYH